MLGFSGYYRWDSSQELEKESLHKWHAVDCWKIRPKIVQQFSHKTNQSVEIGLDYNMTSKLQFEKDYLCLIVVLFGKTCILALSNIKIAD